MKIISTIFYTVFIAMIVGIAGLLLGTMLPIPGNIEMKIVKSGSMEPNIPTGSLVIVKPQSDYFVNDVITFGADTQTEVPTTHRITAKTGNAGAIVFETKGDANEEADPQPVARREVIGKVIFNLPYAGFVLDFARQPLGFALLIAIPAALVILQELLTIFHETRRWWRGRSDRGGKGGGRDIESLGAHLKRVYVKRRAMDEIFVPHIIEPTRIGRILHNDAYGTSTALVLGLVFASTIFSGASGGTLAYFSDIERSIGNIFRAASCDDFIEGSCEEEIALVPESLSLDTLSVDGDVLGEETGAPPAEEEPEVPAVEPEVVLEEEPVDQSAPIDPPSDSEPPPAEPEASPQEPLEPVLE